MTWTQAMIFIETYDVAEVNRPLILDRVRRVTSEHRYRSIRPRLQGYRSSLEVVCRISESEAQALSDGADFRALFERLQVVVRDAAPEGLTFTNDLGDT